MTPVETAIAKFKEIIGDMATWAALKKSQMVKHLAVFQSIAWRDAEWKIERATQEFFLSTALNRSSILAHMEDREYIPRKAQPSTGEIYIKNNGLYQVTIPVYQALSGPNQLSYVTLESAIIAAGATATDISISQLEQSEEIYTVSVEKAFYEIELSYEVTERVNTIEVWVDESDTGSWVEWEYKAKFQNAAAGDTAYDEFFSRAGQIGIRFGNEDFGSILPVGAKVKLIVWLTDGDTFLLENQNIAISGELTDTEGNDAILEIKTEESITGGAALEDTETSRTALHYWPLYNGKVVWNEDYAFFIKQNIADILWISVWGEQEAEELYGASLDYVNMIFISAYKEGVTASALETQILDLLGGLEPLNKTFDWVDPTFSTFTLTITGQVSDKLNISEVIQDIKDAFETDYGKDSASRKTKVFVKDFYKLINETGHFVDAGAYFTVEYSGTIEPTLLNEMVHIDLDASTFTITYL